MRHTLSTHMQLRDRNHIHVYDRYYLSIPPANGLGYEANLTEQDTVVSAEQ